MELTTHDRILIHELLARLDHAVDAQDWDGYVAHFTADAVLDSGFAGEVRGREAIRQWLAQTEGNTAGKRHVASNVFIDPADRGATARSYLTVIEREDVPRVVATAVITDALVKDGEAWRVARHEVRVDPGMFKAFAAAGG
jgi:ketosteroid isomerase-like protein